MYEYKSHYLFRWKINLGKQQISCNEIPGLNSDQDWHLILVMLSAFYTSPNVDDEICEKGVKK